MEVAGFLFFLIFFIVIGLWSNQKKTGKSNDYLLAGGEVSPLLTALSAAATKNSGYMCIGLIGYIYQFGLSAIWLVCGFLFGDLIAYCVVHKKLREATRDTGAQSFAELISKWHGGHDRRLLAVIGIITLVFLSIYAAAQLNAGGKALQVLFNWHPSSGAWIGAGLILIYCLNSGLRASIWTDAAQSILMMLAMLVLLGSAIQQAGGIGVFVEKLGAGKETDDSDF